MSETITVTGPQGVQSEAVDAAPMNWSQHFVDSERQLLESARRRNENRVLSDKWAQEYAEEQASFLRDCFRHATNRPAEEKPASEGTE